MYPRISSARQGAIAYAHVKEQQAEAAIKEDIAKLATARLYAKWAEQMILAQTGQMVRTCRVHRSALKCSPDRCEAPGREHA
jgi:hypothetical protein